MYNSVIYMTKKVCVLELGMCVRTKYIISEVQYVLISPIMRCMYGMWERAGCVRKGTQSIIKTFKR